MLKPDNIEVKNEHVIYEVPYNRFKSNITIKRAIIDGKKRHLLECEGVKYFLKEDYEWDDYLDILGIVGKYGGEIDEKLLEVLDDFIDFIDF